MHGNVLTCRHAVLQLSVQYPSMDYFAAVFSDNKTREAADDKNIDTSQAIICIMTSRLHLTLQYNLEQPGLRSTHEFTSAPLLFPGPGCRDLAAQIAALIMTTTEVTD